MTQKKTKRAHFVPASYLQYWSISGKPEGRKSKLYWTNGNVAGTARAEKLAHQNYLYSRLDPNSAESFFQEFETDWVLSVERLMAGQLPREEIANASFLVQCGFLLLRNPKMDNVSETDRIDTYKSAIEVFFKAVLLDQTAPPSKEEALERIGQVWDMRFLKSVVEPWITSDNPVLTLAYQGTLPVLIYVPITPENAFIAVKRDTFRLGSGLTEQDTRYLNSYVSINSNRQIYSSQPIEQSDVESFKKWTDRRPVSENHIDQDSIRLEPFNYPVLGMELSILKPNNGDPGAT